MSQPSDSQSSSDLSADQHSFSSNFLSRIFKQWAELTYDKPWLAVGVCVVMLVLSAFEARHVKMDMSTEAMLHKNDPARISYDAFRADFGREDGIIISLPTQGLLTRKLMQNIYDLQQAIDERVPHVEKITSLVNARYTYGASIDGEKDSDLIVEDLLEGFPDYAWSDQALTEFVLSQANYRNRLISADGKFTTLVIELSTFSKALGVGEEARSLLSDHEVSDSVDALKSVVAEFEKQWQVDLHLSGEPVMQSTLNGITAESTLVTTILGSVIVIILSYLFFGRLSGVVLPMLIVQTSILSAVGVMGYFGAPFTLTTNAVLALMLGIAVADAVHILSLFYRYYGEHGDKRLAVVQAMSHSAPAVFLTSLTTAIGFMSFMTGDLASTSDLGLYSAIAVSFALFYTITLLPSLIAIFPIKCIKKEIKSNKILDAVLAKCAYLATQYPRVISIGTILVLIASLALSTLQWFSFDQVGYFPDDALEKKEYFMIDQQLAGVINLEVLIDTHQANGIFQVPFIQKFKIAEEALSNNNIGDSELSDSYSLFNILRETHRALNANDNTFYKVEENQQLLAQETLLFEMSEADDLYDVVDDDKSLLRLSLKTHHADGVDIEILVRNLEIILADIFQETATVNITGTSVLVAESVPRAIKTMAKSFIVAVFSIILVMIILMKSLRIGLVSIVPNILPILFGMNFMVMMDWPLTMSTIMVGAIAMGIVVDDTLHLLYHFKENMLKNNDPRAAVTETITSIGPALFITTVIFACCCSSNLYSDVNSVFMFGACMVVVTFSALLADLIVAPAFLVWAYDKPSRAAQVIKLN